MVPSIVRTASPSVGLMPYISLDSIHLPRLSVPRGYCALYGAYLFIISALKGSLGAMNGANIPIIAITSTIVTVATAVLLCKNLAAIQTPSILILGSVMVWRMSNNRLNTTNNTPISNT